MLLDILASKWTLIAVWIAGPAVLFLLYRRNRPKAAPHAAPPPPRVDDKELDTAVTKMATGQGAAPGFRDLKWGDPPPEHGMELVGKDGENAFYTRASDVLRVEDVPVETIQYVFSGAKLSSVRIDAPLHAFDPLLRGLSKHWGPPETHDPKSLKQHWPHLLSGALGTAAILEKNAVSRRTTLFIFRKPESHAA